MSVNSEVHVERKRFDRVGSINNPLLKSSPFNNDFYSRVEFVNPVSIVLAGLYERTIRLPEPIKAWHRASKGTTDKFEGCLTELFPELKNLSEKELKEVEKMRDKV